jgi:nitric oxide reductase NorE protein
MSTGIQERARASANAPLKKAERHVPGEAGIWVFIIGDMIVFALFFLTFAVYRSQNAALYGESHRSLNQAFGLINTLLLLTGSWFVAMAVQSARAGVCKPVGPLLGLGLTSGAGFVFVKILEYSEKIRAGITLTTNEFFMFYFMFTGIHLLHVLIGMVVLARLLVLSQKASLSAHDIGILESGGAFWHLVDLLWIVLFCLFYLLS